MKLNPHATVCMVLLSLTACASIETPQSPTEGLIASSGGGGLSGYQHGFERSKFFLGPDSSQKTQYGYIKRVGSDGTLAIRLSNGSVFGVPNAKTQPLQARPYGKSPEDHNAFVRDYFQNSGLPKEQVSTIHANTLLEATGRSDDSRPPSIHISGYYSVIDRATDGISLPDSFAWARVNSDGRIVQEGVYWPPIEGNVITEGKRFKEILSDQEQRRAYQSRVPVDISSGVLTIRHSSATEDQFTAFASMDVIVRPSAPSRGGIESTSSNHSSHGTTVIVRHFDITGKERFLKQEALRLDDKYPVRK